MGPKLTFLRFVDLKFALLEYQYSTASMWEEWSTKLFGISLDLPSTNLDSTTKFSPPPGPDESTASEGRTRPNERASKAPFLWQSPNSNAMLFLGEKWVELHGFVSKSLEAQSVLKPPPSLLSEKLVSKKYPAWLEHALRLARIRGYWTLYPSQLTASVVAAVHNDLYKPPEEYQEEAVVGKKDRDTEVHLESMSFLDSLPKKGGFPPFQELPLLSWDGERKDLQDFDRQAAEYATNFRRSVGGCGHESLHESAPDPAAQDLFCQKAE